MPELPEVETIRRSLIPLVCSKRIVKVEAFRPEVLTIFEDTKVVGKTITDLRRRGKYLIFDLQDDTADKASIMFHFRMTGKLLYHENETTAAKHTHLRFKLRCQDKFSWLDFNDVRRFGRVWFMPEGGENMDPGFAKLGPEPLGDEWTLQHFLAQIKRHPRSTVKSLLLNQEVVAGIGNIYCDESLFRAGIHPERRVKTLSREEASRLQSAVRSVLAAAVGHQGTTFSDYVDGLGNRGNFQLELKVFQRQGQPCPNCHTEIEKIRVAGRGTHFCPHCQK